MIYRLAVAVMPILFAGCAQTTYAPEPVQFAKPASAAGASGSSNTAGQISLRWRADASDPAGAAVEVRGLGAETLRALEQRAEADHDAWTQVLSVYALSDTSADAASGNAKTAMPSMLGTYSVESGVLRFSPQFPLVSGLKYRAILHPSGQSDGAAPMTADLQISSPRATSAAVVTEVYPTSEVLPENLLKFYIHFSNPMQRGGAYGHIHLHDVSGKPIELPFLELDEELWDPAMTRFTLFLDPGRIKRGVKPLIDIGPSLQTGKQYVLLIDAAWRDAQGEPLKQSFSKRFRVTPPNRQPLNPAKWIITPPRAGTRQPLYIQFPSPMDHALAERLITVLDNTSRRVSGNATTLDHERGWSFIPDAPWPAGRQSIVVSSTIEDLAGNNIGRAFDVDVFDIPLEGPEVVEVKIPFEAR
jgi:hypothetical protein